MTLKHLLPQGMIILALVAGISQTSVAPAQAIAYDYTVTGTVNGTFNADLSVPGGSFNSWKLTTPIATFSSSLGGILSNGNFTLSQLVNGQSFNFFVEPPPATSIYGGTYTGWHESGSFTGSFTLPIPGTAFLMLVGMLALALARWMPTRRERQQLG